MSIVNNLSMVMYMFQSLLNNDNHQQLNSLFKYKGYQLRFVGGCVRDTLLSKSYNDVDFCTDATPEQMLDIPCKKIETGLQHGTITFVINNQNYEVTTLRNDECCDGRHAVVKYTKDFKEDASRRDFTCNALSLDFDGKLYDYFDGIKDIQNHIIRFIGNFDDRIQEDYLRLLRYFRFLIKMKATNNILYTKSNFTKHYIDMVDKVSNERIWSELSKIYSSDNKIDRNYILLVMERYELLSALQIDYYIIPDIDNIEEYLGMTIDDEQKLVSLMKYYKCSNDSLIYASFFRKYKSMSLSYCINYHIMNNIKAEWLIHLCQLKNERNNYEKFMLDLKNYENKIFPINGNILLQRGYTGPDIGKILYDLKLKWIESNFTLTEQELCKDL